MKSKINLSSVTLLTCVVFIAQSQNALAGGSKAPTPPSPPSQQPNNPPKPNPPADKPPVIENPQEDVSDVWSKVDSHFGLRELDRVRGPASQTTDSCSPVQSTTSQPRFGSVVASAIEEHLVKPQVSMGGIAQGYYGVPSEANALPVTLTSHPMCRVTSSGLSSVISSVPSQTVIDKLNRFVDRYNNLRNRVRSGDNVARVEMQKLWLSLVGCLSYVESLTTADGSSSQSVARSYGPTGYVKPDGVLWYIDKYQDDEASKLNIGLYQFAPTSSGNIMPCRLAWSKAYPSCQIPSSTSTTEFKRILGSSHQSFNAYCGVNKIVQTFFTQVNSTKTTAVYPSNISGGRLVAPLDRCVTLHIKAGKAYNHFGPFQNSTGSNLDRLYSCVAKNL